MKPIQLPDVELNESNMVNKRFYLQGGNHLATILMWEGDRLDVFYLPETNKIQTTIEIGNGLYHIYTSNINAKRVFELENAKWALQAGIHTWDDIRTREEKYRIQGNRLVYITS